MAGCLRRFCEIFICRRRARAGDDYILLTTEQDADVVELESFIRDNFSDMGLRAADIATFARDGEVMRHLLRLLPIYKQCAARHEFLAEFLETRCRPHMRPAAEVECQKSRRIVEILDILMLKLVVGEFSLSETDTLERLLEKFSVDQTTLCEVEKIERLINMDRHESAKLMTTEAAEEARQDSLMHRLARIPPIPEDIPGEELEERRDKAYPVLDAPAPPTMVKTVALVHRPSEDEGLAILA